jgi:hypothetical protein
VPGLRRDTRRTLLREGAIALGFLALAIVSTWPWAADALSKAHTGSDGAYYTWCFFWVNKRVFSFENPWWTSDLYAPTGAHLGYTPLLVFPALLAAPLVAAAGAVLAYNLSVLGWLAASGYLTYRLALTLPLSRASAVAAGVVYAACPIVVFRTYLLNILTIAVVLPAALLAARRLTRTRRRRDAALLGCVVGLAILTDQTAAIFVVLALLAYSALLVARRPEWRRRQAVPLAAVAAGVGALVGLPQILASLHAASLAGYETPRSIRAISSTYFSADLAQFVLPSPVSRVFRGTYSAAADTLDHLPLGGADGVKALGWGVIALAVVGVASSLRLAVVRWSAVGALVCAVLALGATLRAFGRTFVPLPLHLSGVRVSGLMPDTWLLIVPGLGEIRVPERFMVAGMLFLALLAGFGTRALSRVRPPVGAVAATCLVALVVVEGTSPLRGGIPREQPRLTEPIRADRSADIVVDVPVGFVSSATAFVGQLLPVTYAMVRATQHDHPISSGYIARIDKNRITRLASRPFYNNLLRLQGNNLAPPPVELPVDAGRSRRDARLIDVGWVVQWPEAGPAIAPFLRRCGFVPVVRVPAPWTPGGAGHVTLWKAPWNRSAEHSVNVRRPAEQG